MYWIYKKDFLVRCTIGIILNLYHAFAKLLHLAFKLNQYYLPLVFTFKYLMQIFIRK